MFAPFGHVTGVAAERLKGKKGKQKRIKDGDPKDQGGGV